jgi:hypothetical protein
MESYDMRGVIEYEGSLVYHIIYTKTRESLGKYVFRPSFS